MILEPLKKMHAKSIFDLIQQSYGCSEFFVGTSWSLSSVEQHLSLHSGLGLWSPGRHLVALILYRGLGCEWEILVVATAPSMQRRGAMNFLLTSFLASRPSEVEVHLEVHEKNTPARGLYERLGFQIIGQRPNYYPDGGTSILYRWIDIKERQI